MERALPARMCSTSRARSRPAPPAEPDGVGKLGRLLSPNEVIDCQGKTLLPGLIDAHTHISGLRYTQPNDSKSPMQLLVKCCQVAQRHLDYGYTTIRDAGSLVRVANFVRAAVEEGV
jgi:imidazolonepropionase-like amidohydrolase